MKVIAINGSPKSKGNTYQGLKTVCDVIEQEGIETEIIHIGNMDIKDCKACGGCSGGHCVLSNDQFKEIINKIYEADGILLGSPVYYAGISGTMKCFLNRLFYPSGRRLRHKVAASLVVPRRSGGVSSYDQFNHYFLIGELLVAPSYYWNVIHGGSPGEILEDGEGMSILHNLGQNIAWMIKMKEATKEILPPPAAYKREWTNFIR